MKERAALNALFNDLHIESALEAFKSDTLREIQEKLDKLPKELSNTIFVYG